MSETREAIEAAIGMHRDAIRVALDSKAYEIGNDFSEALAEDREAILARVKKAELAIQELEQGSASLATELEQVREENARLRSQLDEARRGTRHIRESEHHPTTPAQAKTPVVRDGLAKYLVEKGMQVTDRRASRGRLWVTGNQEIMQSLLPRLEKRGVKFTFAPGGSKSIGGQAGWWTDSEL